MTVLLTRGSEGFLRPQTLSEGLLHCVSWSVRFRCCFQIDTTFGHATSWLDFRRGSLASFHGVSFSGVHDHLLFSGLDATCQPSKASVWKGQVKGVGGNSVGKGAGKAKSQTVQSRRGVAEPSPGGFEQVRFYPL